ncbi:hypothetical protein SeLEV6574_g04662 [Synchytrium endobioticum]|nr:hypothetical protein SeLEV6574_g04662 [Synchytrium endobioticum]
MARLLREREFLHARPNTNVIRQRQCYTAILPNKAIHNIASPPLTFRRFTPDGQYLITFSKHQHALSLYRYNGPPRLNLNDPQVHDRTKHGHTPYNGLSSISSVVWDDLFTFIYERVLTAGSELLCKDFCMFTANKKHMILSSAVPSPGVPEPPPRYPHSIRSITSLDDVTFWIVETETGEILDKKTYRNDYIFLSNHAGVHLLGDHVCIASVQHQSVYILQIKESGKFVELRTIGWFNYEDDELVLSRANDAEDQYRQRMTSTTSPTGVVPSFSLHTISTRSPSSTVNTTANHFTMQWEADYIYAGSNTVRRVLGQSVLRPPEQPDPTAQLVPTLPSNRNGQRLQPPPRATYSTEQLVEVDDESMPLSGLKQRILSYLYRRAVASRDEAAIRHFYLTYPYFAALVMWRVQFIDQHHLMIKMGNLEQVVGKNVEPTTTTSSFFVIYSLVTTQVIGIFDNASGSLLNALESWDSLRGVPYSDPIQFVSSIANNDYARETVWKHMYAVKKARNGGAAQAIKRILSQLPMNPQSFVETPYFDQGLFSYDEKLINSSDRTRLLSDFPVKFYSRNTGVFKFRIDPLPVPFGVTPAAAPGRGMQKRYVQYVFHPTDPLILTSLINPGAPSFINLHVRSV